MIISRLKPNTDYRFRIAATNDVGRSDFSAASDQITTKQAGAQSSKRALILHTIFAQDMMKTLSNRFRF